MGVFDMYVSGHATSGSWFMYNGVKYGQFTKILFKDEFYERFGEGYCSYEWPRKPRFRTLSHIEKNGDKYIWYMGTHYITSHYEDVVPERDIEKIVIPVYYIEPKELVKLRLRDGTWINYIGWQTLFYVVCLIVSPILREWYLVWTIGLYVYLRTSYITLSQGGLYRGW